MVELKLAHFGASLPLLSATSWKKKIISNYQPQTESNCGEILVIYENIPFDICVSRTFGWERTPKKNTSPDIKLTKIHIKGRLFTKNISYADENNNHPITTDIFSQKNVHIQFKGDF